MPALLRGEIEPLADWSQRWDARRLAHQIGWIVMGAGLYGAAMGWWRSPRQALFVALKFPMIMLLTAGGNALINGMLAPLLGVNISFRQSFSVVLMSFAVTASILGAFSPLVAFLVWNCPRMSGSLSARLAYDALLLSHVLIIAFAGSVGNARLFQLLARLGRSREAGLRVLTAWLTANLFLGSQFAYILRPFIGSPEFPVEFLRPNATQGNFYETVFKIFTDILHKS